MCTVEANGHNQVQYVVMQTESGENDTKHFQAYVEFKRAYRMDGVKAIFGDRVHIERRRGSQAQAIAYCKKTDTRVEGDLAGEWGEPKGRWTGRQSMLELAKNLRSGEMDLEEVEENFPGLMCRYKEKIEDYALSLKGRRRWAMEIEIFVGPTGSGKSYTADVENPGAYYVPWPAGGRWWWPGYRGQHCVIMDESNAQLTH